VGWRQVACGHPGHAVIGVRTPIEHLRLMRIQTGLLAEARGASNLAPLHRNVFAGAPTARAAVAVVVRRLGLLSGILLVVDRGYHDLYPQAVLKRGLTSL